MAQNCFDYCPQCGEAYTVEIDEDGSLYSRRKEIECACGSRVFCQFCDPHRCAVCKVRLCNCGGQDLDGEDYCSQHLPKPEPIDIVLTPSEVFSLAEAAHVRI